MTARKPTAKQIAKAGKLTDPEVNPNLPEDRHLGCNVCGLPALEVLLLREHDDKDQKGMGPGSLFYLGLGKGHERCEERMVSFPRLYVEETGEPGTFALCAQCKHREGYKCANPDQRAKGGPGFSITVEPQGREGWRSRGRASLAPKRAIRCAGRLIDA